MTSRTRVKPRYALLPLEGIPYSRLPEWPRAQVRVLARTGVGRRVRRMPAGPAAVIRPAHGRRADRVLLLRALGGDDADDRRA